MIFFCIGTIAELIKLFPLLRRLEQANRPYRIIATGQNDLAQSDLMAHLRTPVSIHLHRGPIRQSAAGLMAWFIRTTARSFFVLRREIPPKTRRESILVVHGDTVSTLMGALVGRALGFQVAHVEAGLRSFDLLSPFPEEACRRVVSRLTTLHFCPNDWAAGNLAKHGGLKISTGGNTLIDSLAYSRETAQAGDAERRLAGKRYFVCVIHRQENIRDAALVRRLLDHVDAKLAEGPSCLFILHEPARAAFAAHGLLGRIESTPGVVAVPRLKYLEFMRVLAAAEFVMTDGGSNQEECSYLGVPCLLLRTATERTEGLGQNVVLSACEPAAITEFLRNPSRYRREPLAPAASPSAIICSKLMEGRA